MTVNIKINFVNNHEERIKKLEESGSSGAKLIPKKLWTGNSNKVKLNELSNYNILAVLLSERNYSMLAIKGFTNFGVGDDIGNSAYFSCSITFSGDTATLYVKGNWLSFTMKEIWGIG